MCRKRYRTLLRRKNAAIIIQKNMKTAAACHAYSTTKKRIILVQAGLCTNMIYSLPKGPGGAQHVRIHVGAQKEYYKGREYKIHVQL